MGSLWRDAATQSSIHSLCWSWTTCYQPRMRRAETERTAISNLTLLRCVCYISQKYQPTWFGNFKVSDSPQTLESTGNGTLTSGKVTRENLRAGSELRCDRREGTAIQRWEGLARPGTLQVEDPCGEGSGVNKSKPVNLAMSKRAETQAGAGSWGTCWRVKKFELSF